MLKANFRGSRVALIKAKIIATFLTTLLAATVSQAAIVWVVPEGEDSESSSRQVLTSESFQVDPLSQLITVDLYIDTQDDDIFGWDFSFLMGGAGTAENFSGDALGLGAPLVNGGYRQFGSDDLALNPLSGAAILLLTFDINWVESGELILDSTSSFVDSDFNTVFFDAVELMEIAEVPVPPALYMFCTGLLGLRVGQRKNQR